MNSLEVFSLESMKLYAKEIGKKVKPGAVITFSGNIGAGKTTFIKSLASQITGLPEEEITSPTFVFLHCYSGKIDLYHFDLYRLNSDDFIERGFEEFLYLDDAICCIEWPEKIASILPKSTIHITLTHRSEDTREVFLENLSI